MSSCNLWGTILGVAIVAISSCSGVEGDHYLRSLSLPAIPLAPIDSIDLERVGVFYPLDPYKCGDWFLFHDAAPKRNSAAVLVNPFLSADNRIEVLTIGRGPGEIASPSDLFGPMDRPMIFDYITRVQLSIDIQSTINKRYAVVDTIGDFSSFRRLGFFLPVNDGYIIDYSDGDNWYGLFNGDVVCSTVKAPKYEVLNTFSHNHLLNYLGNNVVTVNPSLDKVCYASMSSATLSFSRVENGKLMEIKRYEIIPPIASSDGAATARDCPVCFRAITSDDERVYALYSGKPLFSTSDTPSWECSHLIVYDWGGNPIKRYQLKHTVCSLLLEKGILYCGTSYPTSLIISYDLN